MQQRRAGNLEELLKWAKRQGYADIDACLEAYSLLLNDPLEFKEQVWSGGSYWSIVEVKKQSIAKDK